MNSTSMLSSIQNDWSLLDALIASRTSDISSICATISRIMDVQPDEVGVLKIRGLSLEFVYPFALRSSGRIPLTSSAVAARTATSKKPDIFNNFTNVMHNSVFELVPLGTSRGTSGPEHIQKLMSMPVLDLSHKVIGVIQISRKGRSLEQAGPDFTEGDMLKLDLIAHRLTVIFDTL